MIGFIIVGVVFIMILFFCILWWNALDVSTKALEESLKGKKEKEYIFVNNEEVSEEIEGEEHGAETEEEESEMLGW